MRQFEIYKVIVFFISLVLSGCGFDRNVLEEQVYSTFADGSVKEVKLGYSQDDGYYLLKEYYSNGALRKIEPYEKYWIHGEVKYYYENGQLEKKETYQYGIKNGRSEAWYESGEPFVTAEYISDTLQYLKKFYKNGQLMADVPITNGILDSKSIYYDEFGRVYKEGYWKNNKMEGKWTHYDLTGVVHMFEYYENGVLVNVENF